MMSVVIYYVVLLITVGIAVWKGGQSERRAAYVALIASILTSAVTPFPAWTDIEISIFVIRSEEHTSELQSLMRISYAVFCLKKKKINTKGVNTHIKSILDKTLVD